VSLEHHRRAVFDDVFREIMSWSWTDGIIRSSVVNQSHVEKIFIIIR